MLIHLPAMSHIVCNPKVERSSSSLGPFSRPYIPIWSFSTHNYTYILLVVEHGQPGSIMIPQRGKINK